MISFSTDKQFLMGGWVVKIIHQIFLDIYDMISFAMNYHQVIKQAFDGIKIIL